MAKIDCSDLAALKEAEPLLRFAAERIKNLDPDLALAIAEAREAADSDKWSPQVSQRFWHAFAKLCDLIQPATMDCLAAAQPNIEPPRWLWFLGLGKKSIAERSSSRYLFALLVLLVVILPIQLYVWTCTNLSKKIDDLLAAERAKYATLVQDFNKLDVETRNPGRILVGGSKGQGIQDHYRLNLDSGRHRPDQRRGISAGASIARFA